MPKAAYIQVDEIEAHPLEGCARTRKRDLLTSEHLRVSQILIEGPGPAEEYGASGTDRMQYVLQGRAGLRQRGRDAEIAPGALLIIPRGVPWGPGLSSKSDTLTLLEITPRKERPGEAPPLQAGQHEPIRVIRPEDVQPYNPAGHAGTVNRCLFQDEDVEIIEGSIEAGGGADEHLHHEQEQMIYVLEGSDRPLLIYYPKGTPHGTGGGTAVPLKLLVIYAPPLGEARSVLQ